MRKVIIHSQDHIRLICPDEIIQCKSDNCYSTLYLTNGEELVICKSLTKLFKELDPFLFIRVNQSYIVNKNFIRSINKKNKQIELINNKVIPFTSTLKELLLMLEQNAASLILLSACVAYFI